MEDYLPMANLTETAFYTRRFVKFSVFAVIGFVILKIVWGIGLAVWSKVFPPPPPPPTLAFGQLPKINFAPALVASASAQYTYILETVDGKLPKLPVTAKVYFLPQSGVTFGDFDKMRAQASRMGFTGDPKVIPNQVNGWHFDDSQNPLRHMDYNATSGNFHIYYDFGYDLNLFAERNFGSPEEVISQAVAYFSNLGLIRDDLSSGEQKTAYFRLEAGSLVPAESFAEADAVEVNFYREKIKDGEETYPVLTANPRQSLVSITLSGNSNQTKKILDVRYYYWALDRENWATYPLQSATAAFETLKSGGAYVTSLLPAADEKKQITIRKVYLAYLDPFPPQTYLQPVIVFSDEKSFIAFVPAITSNWYK